jgi:hypothetical protein
MKIHKILLSVMVLALSDVSAVANIIDVPDDYLTIQQGIDASGDGDTVLVQPGSYSENVNFNGHNIVLASLFLTTGDTSYIEQTIIDGYPGGTVITVNSGEDSTAMITGLVIQGGSTLQGGGIYCENSSMKVISTIIRFNTVLWWDLAAGGGIYLDNAWARIENNIIEGNVAHGNSMIGWGEGGGIYCTNAVVILRHNLIIGNTAYAGSIGEGNGGGLRCVNSQVYLESNIFLGNQAEDYGGAIRSLGSNIRIINTISRNNGAEHGPEFYGGMTLVAYCDIGDTIWPGEGNIDIDPLFRDAENGDYHLMAIECGDPYDSPCIDMGHPSIIDTLLSCDWGLGTESSDIGIYSGGEGYVGINESALRLPQKISLSQNYPNPFNASTTIRYELPSPVLVKIEIYDILGRKVSIIDEGLRQAGYHQLEWSPADLVSGVYFYRLQAGDFSDIKKMILVK